MSYLSSKPGSSIIALLQKKIPKNREDKLLFNRIFKNFSIGFIGSVSIAMIGIGRTVLLTKSIPIENFGKILIILNFFTVLSSFFGLRVNDVLYRFLPQFEKEQNIGALRGLLYSCLGLSLIVGLLIGIGIVILSPWISIRFYNDAALTWPFRIYSVAMLAYCFDGFNTAILRLYDRFVCLLVPQVVGSGLTFLVIIVYLLLLKASNCCEIGWIIAAFAAGAFIQSIVPFIISIKLIGEKHGWKSKGNPLFALRPYKRLLASNLFHTNLVGYLKIASDNGGVFLLGVLSTPIQVAYFGIAQQMMAPLKLIKVNIQNAITPEIMRLWSRKEVTQLYALINGVVRSTAMWGGVAVVFMVIIIKPLLLIITTSAYISAIPTVCLMILAGFLNFISTSFYPLTVAMDKMPRRNMIVGLRIFYLGAALFIGLNSFLLAAVHLLGVISVRLFSDLPLFLRLRSMSQTGEVKTILNQ